MQRLEGLGNCRARLKLKGGLRLPNACGKFQWSNFTRPILATDPTGLEVSDMHEAEKKT